MTTRDEAKQITAALAKLVRAQAAVGRAKERAATIVANAEHAAADAMKVYVDAQRSAGLGATDA